MKMVRVTGCQDPTWWYSEDIGKAFDLDRVTREGHFMVWSNKFNNEDVQVKSCIHKDDGFVYKLTVCEDCE